MIRLHYPDIVTFFFIPLHVGGHALPKMKQLLYKFSPLFVECIGCFLLLVVVGGGEGDFALFADYCCGGYLCKQCERGDTRQCAFKLAIPQTPISESWSIREAILKKDFCEIKKSQTGEDFNFIKFWVFQSSKYIFFELVIMYFFMDIILFFAVCAQSGT